MIATMTQPTSVYDNLHVRHKAFVDQYISLQNGTKAAIAAGYSPRSARSTAADILAKPTVKAAIEERTKAIGSDFRLTPEAIKKSIAEMAYDKDLKPDTRLKALELAGRATPGTFEPLPQQGASINFFTILGKLGNVQSPVEVIASPSAVESTATLPHPPAKSMPANSLNTTTTSDAISLNTLSDGESAKSNPAGNGQPPHDPSVSENTPTQKFVTQK